NGGDCDCRNLCRSRGPCGLRWLLSATGASGQTDGCHERETNDHQFSRHLRRHSLSPVCSFAADSLTSSFGCSDAEARLALCWAIPKTSGRTVSTASVDATTPPITARPNGACC